MAEDGANILVRSMKRMWYCFRYEDKGVTGFIKTRGAGGAQTTNGAIYSAVALSYLATLISDCDGTIKGLGIKDTSVIAALAFTEGVVSAICSPLWGNLADSTPHRKRLAVASHTFWICNVGLQALLLFSQEEWVFYTFWVSLLLTAVFYELASLLLFAYLPEVTKTEDELTNVTGSSYALMNFMQLLLAMVGAAIGLVFSDLNDLQYAQIAALLTISFWLYFAIPGFMALPSRQRLHDDNDKGYLAKLKESLKEITSVYPQTGIYLASYSFFAAGVANVVVLTTQFVVGNLGYSSTDVVILFGIALIFSVVGALLAGRLQAKFNMKRALMLTVLGWFIVTCIAPFVMLGEDAPVEFKNETLPNGCLSTDKVTRQPKAGVQYVGYLVGVFYGLLIGFVYSLGSAMWGCLIPGGKEASYFGLKTFASKVLTWAPPLIYTVINESSGNQQLAFLSVAPWFLVGLLLLVPLDYEKGKSQVAETLHKRHGDFSCSDNADSSGKVAPSAF